ncbi:hypothetical protein CSUI_004373 [Cystoisospora suis]|uniref:Uncharacterized protein n=1 Tax=Cystoisospora suis TaxID=483139 RepID=A0A2C6KBU1_9APIC|nr:hypothetical protein CSUI_004373 [Cystoisospora suis]
MLGERCEQTERGEECPEEQTDCVSLLLLWLLSEDRNRLRLRCLVHDQSQRRDRTLGGRGKGEQCVLEADRDLALDSLLQRRFSWQMQRHPTPESRPRPKRSRQLQAPRVRGDALASGGRC